MTPEQEQKLNEVYDFIQALKAHASIPFDVERAFYERLGLSGTPLVNFSNTKDADSEDQAVNEAGASSYSVMGDPIGFLPLTIGNTTYYVPYFNS